MNELPTKLSWFKAPGSWFRRGSDLIDRIFMILILVRCALAFKIMLLDLVWTSQQANYPWLVILTALGIGGWTVAISWWLRRPAGRRLWVHVTDLGVTLTLLWASMVVIQPAQRPLALAGFWIIGCALYAAVLRSTRLGMLFAVICSICYLALPPRMFLYRIDVVLVMLLVVAMLGGLVDQFKATITNRERERIRAVALAERERLARFVHDGALQVLALVEREGPSLGLRGIRLAALARESESQLRTLLRDREIVDETQTKLVDLAAALDKYQSAMVTVSTMAGQVMVPRLVVDEVTATLEAALQNVEKHAGVLAQAWVLLDQETENEVILWVRDNGVGMRAEQVIEASQSGRMGIKDSIVGRMAALGGSAVLKASPGAGTEWELRFPIDLGQ